MVLKWCLSFPVSVRDRCEKDTVKWNFIKICSNYVLIYFSVCNKTQNHVYDIKKYKKGVFLLLSCYKLLREITKKIYILKLFFPISDYMKNPREILLCFIFLLLLKNSHYVLNIVKYNVNVSSTKFEPTLWKEYK